MRPFAALLACIGILAGAASPGIAQVEVTRVDKKAVQIGAGENRKIQVGMTGDIYRQSHPIIHPATGENLGSHKIKVARIQIEKVGPDYAVGRYLVQYAPARPGDIVEGFDVGMTPQEQLQRDVSEARAEIKSVAQALAEEINSNKRAIEGLRQTLRSISGSERRISSALNDVRNVRERMVTIENRVGALEEMQKAIIAKDTAEVKKAISAGELRVFRADGTELDGLPRAGEEPVYIQVGDRKYSLLFSENRAVEVIPSQAAPVDSSAPYAQTTAPMATPEPEKGLFEDEFLKEAEEEAVGWYRAYWWLAPVVGGAGVVVVLLLKMMRRRPAAPAAARARAAGDEAFVEASDEEMVVEDEDLAPDLEEVEAAEEEK